MRKTDLKIYFYLVIITLCLIPLHLTLSKYIFSFNTNDSYTFPDYIDPVITFDETSYPLDKNGNSSLNMTIQNNNDYTLYFNIVPKSSNIRFANDISTSIDAGQTITQNIVFNSTSFEMGSIEFELTGPYNLKSYSFDFGLYSNVSNKMIAVNDLSSTYLNTELLKNQIEEISFVGTTVVPNDAIDSFDLSDVDGEETTIGWVYDKDNNGLYELFIGNDTGIVVPSSHENLFSNLTNLKQINFKDSNGVNRFSTENATSMANMFYGDSSLRSLDLSEFNTSNVISMTNMFRGMTLIENLDLSSFDISKVESMESMFQNASSLVVIDFEDANIDSVINMKNVFCECNSLEEIIMIQFDFSNVSLYENMFTNYSTIILVKDEEQKSWLENKFPLNNVIIYTAPNMFNSLNVSSNGSESNQSEENETIEEQPKNKEEENSEKENNEKESNEKESKSVENKEENGEKENKKEQNNKENAQESEEKFLNEAEK